MKNYSKDVLEAVKSLPGYIKLLYKLYRSSGLKRSHRLMLYGAIGYVISPIDLVPGVVPIIGQLDDILVVLTVIYKVIKAYKKDKFEEMLRECNLSLEIVQKDIKAVRDYFQWIGVSSAKVIAHGLKTIGAKGYKAILKTSYK